jgi:hypothetical protein
LIIVKNWQIVKKNEIKKLENELKYLEELSNTSTYKEDTSLKQKLEITIKRLDKLYTEKTKGRQIRSLYVLLFLSSSSYFNSFSSFLISFFFTICQFFTMINCFIPHF